LLNPNYGKAYKNRGKVYTETGESEKALNDFTKVIFLNTDLAEAYELRGKLYKKRGDEERARYDLIRPNLSNRAGPHFAGRRVINNWTER